MALHHRAKYYVNVYVVFYVALIESDPVSASVSAEGRPVAKRLSQAMQTHHGLSTRHADRTLGLLRSARR